MQVVLDLSQVSDAVMMHDQCPCLYATYGRVHDGMLLRDLHIEMTTWTRCDCYIAQMCAAKDGLKPSALYRINEINLPRQDEAMLSILKGLEQV